MEDYETRIWVEYKELESRISSLENMLDNWETLRFEPECSYTQLNKQLITMKMYLYVRLDSDGINEAKPLRNYKNYIEAFNWIKKEGRTNG